jgi:hypothetical protein
VHIIAGLFAGIVAIRIPTHLSNIDLSSEQIINSKDIFNNNIRDRKGSKNPFLKKSGIIFLIFSGILILLSLFDPRFDSNLYLKIIIMLVRSIFIVLVWIYVVYPFAKKLLDKLLKKKEMEFSNDIKKIVALFPKLRSLVSFSWVYSRKYQGISRFKYFIIVSIALLLFSDI